MVPIQRQNQYYYHQSPIAMANQFQVYQNQSGNVNNQSGSINNNNNSTPNYSSSSAKANTTCELQSQQINYITMQQVAERKYASELENPQFQPILNYQPICCNYYQIIPNSLPIAFLPNRYTQLAPPQQQQITTDKKLQSSPVNEVNHQQLASFIHPTTFNHNKLASNLYDTSLDKVQTELLTQNQMNQQQTQSFQKQGQVETNILFSPPQSQNAVTAQQYLDRKNSHLDSDNINKEDEDEDEYNSNLQQYQQQKVQIEEDDPKVAQTLKNQQIKKKKIKQQIDSHNIFEIEEYDSQKESKDKLEITNVGYFWNSIDVKLATDATQYNQQQQNYNNPHFSSNKINQKRKYKCIKETRTSVASASTQSSILHEKLKTKIEEVDTLRNQSLAQNSKNESLSNNYQINKINKQYGSYEHNQNYSLNIVRADNQCQQNYQLNNQQFDETSNSGQSSSKNEGADEQTIKKYCKITHISNRTQINGNITSIMNKSDIMIICSLKPKEKVKKCKQDYYNDSNYTKNLLKGFRRFMKRFSVNRQWFQDFDHFFGAQQLNNELVLKFFTHEEYQCFFNKFLSQPPLWWIQEAKIKDVEKQIDFFNLCRSRKFNFIKTKRKSFQRPKI